MNFLSSLYLAQPPYYVTKLRARVLNAKRLTGHGHIFDFAT
jgi:hypothetical protein